MSDDRPSDVLGALPNTRPHRRSQKRSGAGNGGSEPTPAGSEAAVKPSARKATNGGGSSPRTASRPKPARPRATKPKRGPLKQPAQPAGTPASRSKQPVPKESPTGALDVVGTAVQAAAELAEIGLSVTARVLRSAVSRLPRP